jgi:hypothetical protein
LFNVLKVTQSDPEESGTSGAFGKPSAPFFIEQILRPRKIFPARWFGKQRFADNQDRLIHHCISFLPSFSIATSLASIPVTLRPREDHGNSQ